MSPARYLPGVAKKKTNFVCNQCGSSLPKWFGKCPDCGSWDSLEEISIAASTSDEAHRGEAAASLTAQDAPKAVLIEDIDRNQQAAPRLATGINEFDRVLGGEEESGRGIVPGAAVLIGGDPGIGKSTLMLQAAGRLAETGHRVLYVTSEESQQQLKMRADRLYGDHIKPNGLLHILADTNLSRIMEQATQVKPDAIVIDSIQMIYKADLTAGAGSVTQLRRCSLELIYFAKASGIALLLVGHVTKSGQLAGPRLLEHMVDTVLYFEGDRYHAHRVVRGIKNRFGNTLEVGLFEMSDSGLREVENAAGLLAAEYQARPGSVITPVFQGSRCLLVELQALVATGVLGAAKRKVSNLDSNRLAVLVAVLEKHAGLRLADQDVFVSSVGGIKVVEPAADLALLLAIAGAYQNRAMQQGTCAIGEVGLGGEIRRVSQIEQRMHEAARLGFTRIITAAGGPAAPKGLELLTVKNVQDAIEILG